MWNWKKEFTAAEFRSTFPSPSPNKVLHDMVKKGLLEKVGWGRYRVNSPRKLKQSTDVELEKLVPAILNKAFKTEL